MSEFRIEYSIKRSEDGEDFTEIGFGSSGAWGDVDSAVHAVTSYIQNRQWETGPGMPDPDEVDAESQP